MLRSRAGWSRNPWRLAPASRAPSAPTPPGRRFLLSKQAVEAVIKKPIKELHEELDPDGFWQIHRGTIVNLRAIARVERDWRDQPVIPLKVRPGKLSDSRTIASRFKAMQSSANRAARREAAAIRGRGPRYNPPLLRSGP